LEPPLARLPTRGPWPASQRLQSGEFARPTPQWKTASMLGGGFAQLAQVETLWAIPPGSPGFLGYRGGGFLPVQAGCVGPEPVEVVEVPRLLEEDVDDKVAVVEERPRGILEPLGADGPRMALVL